MWWHIFYVCALIRHMKSVTMAIASPCANALCNPYMSFMYKYTWIVKTFITLIVVWLHSNNAVVYF